MRKFELYRFRDGITPLDEQELNSRFFDLDLRINSLEELKDDIEENISKLVDLGIKRIDDVIVPKMEQLDQDKAMIIQQLSSELSMFQMQAQQLLAEIQILYEIFVDPVMELTELQVWKGLLDPHGDGRIRPDRQIDGSLTIAYDVEGRITEIVTELPYGDYKLQYTYNADGYVSTEAAMLGTKLLWTKTYQYNTSGELESVSLS